MTVIAKSYRFRDHVRGDLYQHTKAHFNWLRVMMYLRRPSFLSVFIYRVAAKCSPNGLLGRAGARLFTNLNLLLHSCDISVEACIAPGLILVHPMGVVIGRATIGENAQVMQNVAIAAKTLNNENFAPEFFTTSQCPIIGDNVYLAAGVVVLGPVYIGNNAVIGANAVVLNDVPTGKTAVGIPARVLSSKVVPTEPIAQSV